MAVPVKSVVMASVGSILELSERARAELQTFFEVSVKVEGKELAVLGWSGPDEADALVR